MKRLWPILIPSLLLVLRTWLLVTLLLTDEATSETNTQLKISIAEQCPLQVSSCIPGISWIKFVNTHPSKSIEIFSVDIIEIDIPNNRHQSFFDRYDDDLLLSLGPGESEYVPLIFLPRNNDINTRGEYEATGTHKAVVKVRTSDGTIHSYLEPFSSKPSEYGLPPGLYFQGVLRKNFKNQIVPIKWDYDIFLHNPSQENLFVYEVFTTEPDWVDFGENDEFNVNMQEPIVVKPHDNAYICTVVVFSSSVVSSLLKQFEDGDFTHDEIVMGSYLHIRTNIDEMLIPVDINLRGVTAAIQEAKVKIDEEKLFFEKKQNKNSEFDSSTQSTLNNQNTGSNNEEKRKEISLYNEHDNTDNVIGYEREEFFFPTTYVADRDIKISTFSEGKNNSFRMSFLSNALRRRDKELMSGIIQRTINLTNKFTQSLTLLSMKFALSECKKWFHLENVESLVGSTVGPGEQWLSKDKAVTLTYYGNYSKSDTLPFSGCSLLLQTNKTTHQIPIIIYGDELFITAEADALPSPCQPLLHKNKDIRECGSEWWDASSLVDDVKSNLLHKYDSTLLPLNFGAITAGEVSVRSLKLVNLNPMPIEVFSSKTNFEGMEISLGRTNARLVDYIPSDERIFWNHPFFPELAWKNDIQFSSLANENLRQSFIKHGTIELFREANWPSVEFYHSSNSTQISKDETGGMIFSLDGQYQKELSYSSSPKTKSWSIPPGAEARFDIYVQAPSKDALKKDITSFVASGLILETETSAIELIITFDTLLENLELSTKNNKDLYHVDFEDYLQPPRMRKKFPQKALRMPPYLRSNDFSQNKLNPNTDPSIVNLYLSSTFTNEFVLHDLESCNRWFSTKSNITYKDKGIAMEGMDSSHPVGHLVSSIWCKGNNFFSCATDWLENRKSIQPNGCGLQNDIINADEKNILSIKDVDSKYLPALKEAADYVTSIQSTPSTGEILSNSIVLRMEKAHEAWEKICSLGLHRISTTIYAKILHGNESNDSILTRVPALYAETQLSLPNINNLSNSTLDFSTIGLLSTKYKFITVSNPTAMQISVRLNSYESPNLFLQQFTDSENSWWTGSRYWMGDGKGNTLQSQYNVTIKSTGGAYVSLVNPSLHVTSSFILGCGKLCALRNEANSIDAAQSFIGASAVQGMSKDLNSVPPPAFALSYRSLSVAEIPPFGKVKLGPIYFRPPYRGEFTSEVYLQNSLNGLEKVKLKGFGGLEKIAFLHEDIEQRIGRPALVFSGSAGLDEIAVVKHLTLANLGDVSMLIKKIYINTSEIVHFSSIKPYPKKKIEKSEHKCKERGFELIGCDSKSLEDGLENKEFRKRMVNEELNWLYSFMIHSKHEHSTDPANIQSNGNHSTVDEDEFSYIKHGFVLHPGENKTIIVKHFPDCVFRTEYVSLNVETMNHFSSINDQDELHDHTVELLMGYDMDRSKFAKCKVASEMGFSDVRNYSGFLKLLYYIFASFWSFVMAYWIVHRFNVSTYFRGMLNISSITVKTISENSSLLPRTDFSSVLSSFAKIDPSSQELITKRREQTKHIVRSYYCGPEKTHSRLYCIQPNGDFIRDSIDNNLRLTNSSKTSIGNTGDESKLYTDIIFGCYNESKYPNPCGLGWKFAADMNIISTVNEMNSINERNGSNGVSRVIELMRKRSEQFVPHNLQDNEENTGKPKILFENKNDVANKEDEGRESKHCVDFALEKATKEKLESISCHATASKATERSKVESEDCHQDKMMHCSYATDKRNLQQSSTCLSKVYEKKSSTQREGIDYNTEPKSTSLRKKKGDLCRLSQKNEIQTRQGVKPQSNRNTALKSNRKVNSQTPDADYSLFSDSCDSKKLFNGTKREQTNYTPPETEANLRLNIYSKQSYPSGSTFSYSTLTDETNETNEKIRYISPPRSPLKGGRLVRDLNSTRISKDSSQISMKKVKPKPTRNMNNARYNCDEERRFSDLNQRISPHTDHNVMEGSNIANIGAVRTVAVPIRPPPGLPPPPGFASESDAAMDFKKSAVDTLHDESVSITSSNDDLPRSPIFHTENIHQMSDNLVSTMQSSLLGESASLNLLEAPMNNSNQVKTSVSAIGSEREIMGSKLRMGNNGLDSMQSNMVHFGFDGGFNIENYVTNILNESSDIPNVDEMENGRTKATNSMTIVGSNNYNMNNPWESSLGGHVAPTNECSKPRERDYGVSIGATNTLDHDTKRNTFGNIGSSFDNDYQFLKISHRNEKQGHPEHKENAVTFDDVNLGTKVTTTCHSDVSSSLKEDEVTEDDFFDDDSFFVSLVGE